MMITRNEAQTKILFICLGNICRSPAAHAVFQKAIEERGLTHHYMVDSAGIGDWHVGQLPDRRMMAQGKKRGYCINHHARGNEVLHLVWIHDIEPQTESSRPFVEDGHVIAGFQRQTGSFCRHQDIHVLRAEVIHVIRIVPRVNAGEIDVADDAVCVRIVAIDDRLNIRPRLDTPPVDKP